MSEEKTTPSTNIPLLLSQKSEQSTSQKQSDKLYPFKVPYTLLPLNSFWLFFSAQKVFYSFQTINFRILTVFWILNNGGFDLKRPKYGTFVDVPLPLLKIWGRPIIVVDFLNWKLLLSTLLVKKLLSNKVLSKSLLLFGSNFPKYCRVKADIFNLCLTQLADENRFNFLFYKFSIKKNFIVFFNIPFNL